MIQVIWLLHSLCLAIALYNSGLWFSFRPSYCACLSTDKESNWNAVSYYFMLCSLSYCDTTFHCLGLVHVLTFASVPERNEGLLVVRMQVWRNTSFESGGWNGCIESHKKCAELQHDSNYTTWSTLFRSGHRLHCLFEVTPRNGIQRSAWLEKRLECSPCRLERLIQR